ncbi:MAG TPA: MFS transporter [Conexibacter sp.]|nr:MFS transporter [Conexibacter sp.]
MTTGRSAATRRALRPEEKRVLALLGLPTAALALAITVVTTYLPVVARSYLDSTTVIGVLIGLEGVMALWVPLVVGAWSDDLRTPLGGRLPFLIAATPIVVVSLALIGFANSTSVAALAASLFFFAYFVAYEPYRALYPDLVADDVAGRAQSSQAIFRGVGTGLALVGGGLLVSAGHVVPFLVAAAFTAMTMVAFVQIARRRRRGRPEDPEEDVPRGRTSPAEILGLLRGHPELRAYLLANALWEGSLSALKTFVFLFVVTGVGLSESAAAGVIGAVALVALVGAPISGAVGDRIGRVRLVLAVLPVYGVGLLVPAFTHATVFMVPTMLIVGFAGGLVMTLPYAILQPLMPQGHHGALTGFYSLSRGVGSALGPLAAGLAIQLLASDFPSTQGYAAMWLVCGATILLSLWPTRRLARAVGDG